VLAFLLNYSKGNTPANIEAMREIHRLKARSFILFKASSEKIILPYKVNDVVIEFDCVRPHIHPISPLLEQKDKWGRTPLFWAILNGHVDAAKLLLENGAMPTTLLKAPASMKRKTSHVMESPLHALMRADILNKFQLAKLLMQYGVVWSAINGDRETPFHVAIAGEQQPQSTFEGSSKNEVVSKTNTSHTDGIKIVAILQAFLDDHINYINMIKSDPPNSNNKFQPSSSAIVTSNSTSHTWIQQVQLLVIDLKKAFKTENLMECETPMKKAIRLKDDLAVEVFQSVQQRVSQLEQLVTDISHL
jgi:hypothetical protein